MPHIMESTQLTTADLADAANRAENPETATPETVAREPRQTEEQYSGPLLTQNVSDDMRTRWEKIQTAFVDDPRASVREADELVAFAIKQLAESFAGERGKLEQQWSSGNDVSTEDLRQALRRYRAFFHRLLSV